MLSLTLLPHTSGGCQGCIRTAHLVVDTGNAGVDIGTLEELLGGGVVLLSAILVANFTVFEAVRSELTGDVGSSVFVSCFANILARCVMISDSVRV